MKQTEVDQEPISGCWQRGNDDIALGAARIEVGFDGLILRSFGDAEIDEITGGTMSDAFLLATSRGYVYMNAKT